MSELRIVVLDQGFVFVGLVSWRQVSSGRVIRVEKAACVRRWGTSKGLGELAASGPLENTVLDPSPPIEAHELTVVLTMECVAEAWAEYLEASA